MLDHPMLDWMWAIVVIVFLVLVAWVFVKLWREGSGGLNSDDRERLAAVEAELARVSAELRAGQSRWPPR